jgi:bifunctional lysine-specific demethylase and histidyl-hydroxylase NO66
MLDYVPSSREAISPGFQLDWLLNPVTADHFAEAYWESRPLLITRNKPDYFTRLPRLDDMDELITATTSGSTRSIDDGRLVRARTDGGRDQREFRTAPNGIPDIQDVYRAYDEGYSVVLNRVHRRSASVAALCRALEADLHHPVGANMYLTPQQSQGFPAHVDTHDVFVLQLHGVKEWHVENAGSDLPLASARHDRDEPSSGELQSLTLRPGDVLYLPRGILHEAVTSSSSSLHLTVGIHVYRWVDFLNEALKVLAEERLTLRHALPRGFLHLPLEELRVSEIAAELASALTEEGVAERARLRLGAKLRGDAMTPLPGHFRSIDGIPRLTGDSVVIRVPGSLCGVRATGDEVLIEFATNYVAGPAVMEPALTFIAEHERFTVNDLPGELSGQDKLGLVGRLISEGLLSLP